MIFLTFFIVFVTMALNRSVYAGLNSYFTESNEFLTFFNRSTSVNNKNQTTLVIIGNQITAKAEIYQLTFTCRYDVNQRKKKCNPLPLGLHDLVWSSMDTPGISEVKYVVYQGKQAVLCTIDNGAIVYEYPSGDILFHKQIETSHFLNIHSAEVLPDGNVVVAGSTNDGIFAVLYPSKGGNITQKLRDTIRVKGKPPYGHGVVYDKNRNLLYAAGYLTFLVLEYSSGSDGRGAFEVLKNISLEAYYDETDKQEDANHEDGAHDLYPVDGNFDVLFLTTGEHVFVIDINDFTITKFPNLYTIPSQSSRNKPVSVKDKGGVKGLSLCSDNGVILAKSAPWFKEYYKYPYDRNYNVYAPVLLWTTMNNDPAAEHCFNPGYDVGDSNCRINFDSLLPHIAFYKARVFNLPEFSYSLDNGPTAGQPIVGDY